MIKLKDRKKNELGIMISPMIDMSFLLLVFFIVTTMNMSEVETVPVQLPAATRPGSSRRPGSTCGGEGGTQSVPGDETGGPREALIAQAKAAAAKDPQFSLVIYGDGQVPYEKILGLLDDCKAAGSSVWAWRRKRRRTMGSSDSRKGLLVSLGSIWRCSWLWEAPGSRPGRNSRNRIKSTP